MAGVPSPDAVPVRIGKQVTLLFLESVGTTELLVILIAALVLFGPRKLPELSRSLGKGLNEFKRASDEFKRTWEREVNVESYERERRTTDAMLPPEEPGAQSASVNMIAESSVAPEALIGANTIARGAGEDAGEPLPLAPADSHVAGAGASAVAADATEENTRRDAPQAAPQSPHKADWL
jgi:TatA/E family protein of Tat protein translocase